MPSMLTTAQAAAMLGIHPQTLRKLIRAGDIPAYRIHHHYRLHPTDLAAFLKGRSA